MRTDQEIFDTVVNHLRQQNKTCENSDGCLYRNDRGMKCAVGCLIPDWVYSPGLEGKTVSELVSGQWLPDMLCQEFRTNLSLLVDLQRVHDSLSPKVWEDEFQMIAATYNLSLPQKGTKS